MEYFTTLFANTWNWIKENPIQTYLAIVGAASWIVKLTPTLKDDNVLLWIVKIIGKFVAVDKYGPTTADRTATK